MAPHAARIAGRLAGLALLALSTGSLAHAGTLEGQVVHQGGPAQLKGLPISVVFRGKDGGFDRASTTTAADGRFRVDNLKETGPHLVFVEYKDITYPPEMVELEKLDSTGSVRLEVFDPSNDGSKLRIAELKTVIGRAEAGVYRVQHLIGLENNDRAVLRRPQDAEPLARFGLLPNRSSEIGASLMFTPADLTLSDDGAAEYRGPIFPGMQWLTVTYEVDAGGRDLISELSFPQPVERFDLYVRDQGLAIFAQPLHPSQLHVEREQGTPVPYQSYVGFDIAAGTRIPLRFETLPEPGTSQVTAAALVALLFGALCVFVGFPITEGARATARIREPEPSDVTADALVASLADLEHDFEMGKISAEDRERLREELRREALQEMARRSVVPAPRGRRRALPASAAPSARVCSCGQTAAADARFCSACGLKLE
jgi:hypothetical protein